MKTNEESYHEICGKFAMIGHQAGFVSSEVNSLYCCDLEDDLSERQHACLREAETALLNTRTLLTAMLTNLRQAAEDAKPNEFDNNDE